VRCGLLVTCALRRGELSGMNCEHLAMRDGRWVFLDFKGKGNKTRSVAVLLWVKQEIDGWLDVAGIEKGPIFRRVLANGRVGRDALTERAGVAAGAGVRSADRDRRAGAA
jgi:integrase